MKERSRLQSLFDDIDREQEEKDNATVVFTRKPREKLVRVNRNK